MLLTINAGLHDWDSTAAGLYDPLGETVFFNDALISILNSTRTSRLIRPSSDISTINIIAPNGVKYNVQPL